MNQIICTGNSNLENSYNINSSKILKSTKKEKFFKLLFLFFAIAPIPLIINYLSFRYRLINEEKIAKNIAQSYRNN